MSRGDTPQVFLSRTHELEKLPTEKSFVAAAVEAVNGVGGSVVDQTNFPPSDQSPVDYCRKRLAKASHYVGIIGFRYGAPVPGNLDKSYVGMEFDTATTLELQRFVFLLDENATLPMPNVFQHDPEYQKQQQEFRAWLENDSGVTIRRVGTPHELARFLTQLLLEEEPNPAILVGNTPRTHRLLLPPIWLARRRSNWVAYWPCCRAPRGRWGKLNTAT